MIELQVKAVSGFRLAWLKVNRRYQRGYSTGLEKVGRYILGLSKRVVPVDTGYLKSTAYSRTTGRGFTTRLYLGYSAPYAIYQHENLWYKHKKGKTAKFLERPLKKNKRKIGKMITEEMRKANSKRI